MTHQLPKPLHTVLGRCAAAAISLTLLTVGLTDGASAQERFIKTKDGFTKGELSKGEIGDNYRLRAYRYTPTVWIDPDGCEHWVFDDGFEGFMTPHVLRDGSPVCHGRKN